MKKVFIILLISISTCFTAFAQKTTKLGHIDSQELLKIMPGRDSAQTKLQSYVTELESTLKSMETELEQRYNEFVANQNQMSDLIKQTKQRELQDMSLRIEDFRKNAQQELQQKEASLLQPIIDKAKQAIADVAKENKFTYIFDSAALLYSDDGEDVLPLVKKKLGLKL